MKTLVFAALVSALVVLPALPSAAADLAAAPKPTMDAKCFFLPLLPDCLAAWKADHDAMMAKMTPPKSTAMAAPVMTVPKMPMCTKATTPGHILDCTMK
jgi:hypothetical protein